MKKTTYLILMMTGIILTSCFQDLEQNPPFDYPEQPTPPPIGADGQMCYLSFDKNLEDYQSLMEAAVVGSPSFVDGKSGKAYAGAANSYLTFDVANLAAPLGSAMTFTFWYKVNATPDRAGILVIGPPDEGKAATAQNNRIAGISWNKCDLLSIGSGAPRFNEWGHLSDQSLIDELRIYNKALPASEIERLAAQ